MKKVLIIGVLCGVLLIILGCVIGYFNIDGVDNFTTGDDQVLTCTYSYDNSKTTMTATYDSNGKKIKNYSVEVVSQFEAGDEDMDIYESDYTQQCVNFNFKGVTCNVDKTDTVITKTMTADYTKIDDKNLSADNFTSELYEYKNTVDGIDAMRESMVTGGYECS